MAKLTVSAKKYSVKVSFIHIHVKVLHVATEADLSFFFFEKLINGVTGTLSKCHPAKLQNQTESSPRMIN